MFTRFLVSGVFSVRVCVLLGGLGLLPHGSWRSVTPALAAAYVRRVLLFGCCKAGRSVFPAYCYARLDDNGVVVSVKRLSDSFNTAAGNAGNLYRQEMGCMPRSH